MIVSASPIPGNEEYVARTVDNLFKLGANVYYHANKRAHVSGHASQEELKMMLNLVRPKYFVPPTLPRTPTWPVYGTPPGVRPGDWPTYAPLGMGGYRFPAVGNQAYR